MSEHAFTAGWGTLALAIAAFCLVYAIFVTLERMAARRQAQEAAKLRAEAMREEQARRRLEQLIEWEEADALDLEHLQVRHESNIYKERGQ